jgi:hypothetical protein
MNSRRILLCVIYTKMYKMEAHEKIMSLCPSLCFITRFNRKIKSNLSGEFTLKLISEIKFCCTSETTTVSLYENQFDLHLFGYNAV